MPQKPKTNTPKPTAAQHISRILGEELAEKGKSDDSFQNRALRTAASVGLAPKGAGIVPDTPLQKQFMIPTPRDNAFNELAARGMPIPKTGAGIIQAAANLGLPNGKPNGGMPNGKPNSGLPGKK